MRFEHNDAVVVRSRRTRQGYVVKFLVGNTVFEALSSFPISEGTFGTLRGVITPEGMVVKEAEMEALSPESLERVKRNVEESVQLEEVEPLAPIPERMWEDMKRAARKIKAAELLSSYNVMRFHGDADGISAAFQLSFLPSVKIQQHSPHYTPRDALGDVASANSSARFLLLLDLVGEDGEGLDIARSGGFDVVVVDHHEHQRHEGVLEINPWHHGLESSYTAGYLSYEIARLLGRGEEEWLRVSLAGDKSDLLPVGEKDREKAMALDYLATYAPNNLEFYRKAMADPSLYRTIVLNAEDSMLELKQLIVRQAKKKRVGEAWVYLINTDAVKRKKDFPSRAKVTTLLFEMVKDKEAIAVGHSSRVVTLRLSPSLAEKGVDVRKIIERVKAQYPDIVISGGGHPRAGSILFLEGYKDLILTEVLNAVREMA